MSKELQRRTLNLMAIISLGMLLFSCIGHPGSFKDDDTPTSGSIKVAVDESYKLLMDTEINTFQSIYNRAHIQAFYKPELEVVKDLLSDSLQLIVTSRKLSKNEEEYLQGLRLIPRTTTIAYDALALIINNNNPDSLIRYNDVRNIFEGKTDNWKKINPKSPSNELKVVFDNEKSGNVRYFVEKFKLPNKLPKYCYAVNSNEEVVNYVEKHVNSIGILSVNWVSDKNDSLSNAFLKRIKVVAITSEFNSDGDDWYRPYQAYIADKSYPFIREVYVISRQSFMGLGYGFTQFLAGETGQRIILKSKLVPAIMPTRTVRIKE